MWGKIPCFGTRAVETLPLCGRMWDWNMPCGNASAAHATDLTEQGTEAMCMPVPCTVRWLWERHLHITCVICHSGFVSLMQHVRYSPDCCAFSILLLINISHFILHSCRKEVIWVMFYSNRAQLLRKEITGLSNSGLVILMHGAVHKGNPGQVAMALGLHPYQKDPPSFSFSSWCCLSSLPFTTIWVLIKKLH